MKIFDLHADLGEDVYQKHLAGEENVLKNHHFDKLAKGEVDTICMASYFVGNEDWDRMKTEIEQLEQELKNQDEYVYVLNSEMMDDTKKMAIMSVEGMCPVRDDEVNKVQWLYDHGVRLASFTWNDENELATGAKGNPERGLTEKGRNALAKMDELHMIVDVSHANEKSFWDILNASKGMIIATHSNAFARYGHYRNLKDEQCIAIAEKGGLIGMNAARWFTAKEEADRSVEELARHAYYLKELVGADHVACGFDFMDYFEDGADAGVDGLQNAAECQNFVDALYKVGFTEEEVKKVCYYNAYRVFKEYLF